MLAETHLRDGTSSSYEIVGFQFQLLMAHFELSQIREVRREIPVALKKSLMLTLGEIANRL